jgi:hypothetical protein
MLWGGVRVVCSNSTLGGPASKLELLLLYSLGGIDVAPPV